MESKWQPLNPDDALRFDKKIQFMQSIEMFSPEMLRQVLSTRLTSNDSDKPIVSEEGMPVKVLKAGGSGWQSGRARITIEFLPDDPS